MSAPTPRQQRVQQFELHPGPAYAPVLANVEKFLRGLSPERHWQIEVKPWHRRRSEKQNGYLWAVAYRLLSEHTGHEPDELHEMGMCEFFGTVKVEVMGRVVERRARTSTKLSTVEFADYVSWLQRKGAEVGCYIPDPDPFHAEREEG